MINSDDFWELLPIFLSKLLARLAGEAFFLLAMILTFIILTTIGKTPQLPKTQPAAPPKKIPPKHDPELDLFNALSKIESKFFTVRKVSHNTAFELIFLADDYFPPYVKVNDNFYVAQQIKNIINGACNQFLKGNFGKKKLTALKVNLKELKNESLKIDYDLICKIKKYEIESKKWKILINKYSDFYTQKGAGQSSLEQQLILINYEATLFYYKNKGNEEIQAKFKDYKNLYNKFNKQKQAIDSRIFSFNADFFPVRCLRTKSCRYVPYYLMSLEQTLREWQQLEKWFNDLERNLDREINQLHTLIINLGKLRSEINLLSTKKPVLQEKLLPLNSKSKNIYDLGLKRIFDEESFLISENDSVISKKAAPKIKEEPELIQHRHFFEERPKLDLPIVLSKDENLNLKFEPELNLDADFDNWDDIDAELEEDSIEKSRYRDLFVPEFVNNDDEFIELEKEFLSSENIEFSSIENTDYFYKEIKNNDNFNDIHTVNKKNIIKLSQKEDAEAIENAKRIKKYKWHELPLHVQLTINNAKARNSYKSLKQFSKSLTKRLKAHRKSIKLDNISKVLKPFSKLIAEKHIHFSDVSSLYEILSEVVINTINEQGGFSDREIAHLANAYAKVIQENENSEIILNVVRNIADIAENWTDAIPAQFWAMVANLLSKLNLEERPENYLNFIEKMLSVATGWRNESFQTWALVANLLSKLSPAGHSENYLNFIETLICFTGTWENADPQSCAMVAHSLSKLRTEERSMDCLVFINRLVKIAITWKDTENPQNWAMVAYLLSKLSPDEYPRNYLAFAEKILNVVPKWEDADPQSWAMIISFLCATHLKNLENKKTFWSTFFAHLLSVDFQNKTHPKAWMHFAKILLLPLSQEQKDILIDLLAQVCRKYFQNILHEDQPWLGHILLAFHDAGLKQLYIHLCIEMHEACCKNIRTAEDSFLLKRVAYSLFGFKYAIKENGHRFKSYYILVSQKLTPDFLKKQIKHQENFSLKPHEAASHFIYLLIINCLPFRSSKRNKKNILLSWLVELQQILSEHSEDNQAELSWKRWNVLAELRFELEDEIMDEFIKQCNEKLDEHSELNPYAFDPFDFFSQLMGEPRKAPKHQGAIEIPYYSMRGKKLDTTINLPYSFFSRITDGKIPLAKIKLPCKVHAGLLMRLVVIEGISYRFDFFGGSDMKPVSEKFSVPGSQREFGSLIAAPIQATGAGHDLTHFLQSLFPYKEGFFYMKRALLPTIYTYTKTHHGQTQSKENPDHQRASVLEGTFQIGIFVDQPQELPHPFNIMYKGESTKLRIHDGFGYIKRSLLEKFLNKSAYQDRLIFGHNLGNCSYQALQWYERKLKNDVVFDDAVEELTKSAYTEIKTGRLRPGDKNWPFFMSNAGLQGEIVISCPVSGENVCLPNSNVPGRKNRLNPKNEGLLLGRAPYNAPHLHCIESNNIEFDQKNATTQLLSQLPTVQYSLVGIDQKSLRYDKPTYRFFKGLLGVIPDEYWPENYINCHLVLSNQDEKSCTKWKLKKALHQKDTQIAFTGSLQIVDYYPPGSLIGVPPNLQSRLGGDYDGDHNFVLLTKHYPRFHALVKQFPPPLSNLKLSKTFTPVQPDCLSRAQKIVETRNSLMEKASTYTALFLFLNPQQQYKLALKLQNRYVEKSKQEALPAILTLPEKVENEFLLNWIKHILSYAVQLGTDAYKTDQPVEAFVDFLKYFASTLVELQLPTYVPYSKNFSRKVNSNSIFAEDLRRRQALLPQQSTNLPAALMQKLIQFYLSTPFCQIHASDADLAGSEPDFSASFNHP